MLEQLDHAITTAMPGDQYRLRRLLREIRQAEFRGRPFDRKLERFERLLRDSAELREWRHAHAPSFSYDPELPITASRDEIARAISRHPVSIVCGDTGSGKSTQLPKICLELGRGRDGSIGITQPRRLAARSVAARIAEELHTPLGEAVGFKIRFHDRSSPRSFVKVMTDGVLLAELHRDRFLNHYDTLIIDEAHERSLNIDFLLGYLKRLLNRRPDLRVVMTSATLDAARFSRHFGSPQGPAPVIEVAGRTYPIEVRYQPPVAEPAATGDGPSSPIEETDDDHRRVCRAVEELLREPEGDVLVFLPTERDIREVARRLRGRSRGRDGSVEVLPLYARLSFGDQQRVFQPHPGRRIVLATNVAESSLTVPGIRYVVDTGTARVSRYSPRAKIQRLPVEAISRASAEQRKGRCGRVGPGICIRLYSEEDFASRAPFTTPEIQRTSLAAVILQTKAVGIASLEDFPFPEPPRPEAVRDGYRTLFELGALDAAQNLTEIGRALSRLPVDPRVGRMILAAEDEHCLSEVLIIAAGLEVQDPRERPPEFQEEADRAHAVFTHDESDFSSLLKLWDHYQKLREELSQNQLRKACRRQHLSYSRLREWSDVHRQLCRVVSESGRVRDPREDDYDRVHRALLAGLLSGVSYRTGRFDYLGAGGKRLLLWPGSAPFKTRPKWVMAAEIVETTRRYARTAARIDSRWVEPLAEHLVKRSYREPHWSRKRGRPMVYERVTLFGLPLVRRRAVPLGPLDPDHARHLFIQHALVEGNMPTTYRFLQHNATLLKQLEQEAAKLRQSQWFVGEHLQYVFYDQRLPRDVWDLSRLKAWLRKSQAENSDPLEMQRNDLLREELREPPAGEFPDRFRHPTADLPLEYRFAPGTAVDGITITVPREKLGQLDVDQIDWLVPGRLEERIVALIRAFPKDIRRGLVPVPDTARAANARLRFGEGPFRANLASVLEEISGERIPLEIVQSAELPPHLRMNIRVVDDNGQVVAEGRDLARLKQDLRTQPVAEVEPVEQAWHADGIRSWSFPRLPLQIEIDWGAARLPAFPAVVDAGDSVSLRLYRSTSRAETATRRGVRRLFCLAANIELRAQVAWLPGREQLHQLAATVCGETFDIDQAATELLAERAFLRDPDVPRDRDAFAAACAAGKDNLSLAAQEVTDLLMPLLEACHTAREMLASSRSERWRYAGEDIERQLAELTAPGFLTETEWTWLQRYACYFRGIEGRLDRLKHGGLARDRQAFDDLEPYLEAWRERRMRHAQREFVDPELTLFRWMLEEFRISLFAQQLGTAMPVSIKRLDQQWEKVER